MQVSFYTNSSDKRMLSKNISHLTTADASLKEPCDVLRPVFLLRRSSLSSYSRCNYMYVPALNRYYFCDVTMETGAMLRVNAKEVDVAMTYASNIRALSCTIVRQENNYNKYISDALLPVRLTRHFQRVSVGTYDAGVGLYLTVDGGKQNE